MRIDIEDIFIAFVFFFAISAVTFVLLAFIERDFWFAILGVMCIPGSFTAFDIVCKIKSERRKQKWTR